MKGIFYAMGAPNKLLNRLITARIGCIDLFSFLCLKHKGWNQLQQ